MASKTINFFKGHPTETLLPNKTIVEATAALLTGTRDYDYDPEERHPLTYGSDQGARWVRGEVAKFHKRVFGEKCGTTTDDINLTGGASYGIMNILTQTTLAHTGYTKRAFIITPTYYLINETFLDAGFGGKLTAIDELQGGIDFEQLESKLEYYNKQDETDHSDDLKMITNPNGSQKKVYKFVLYCIPSFSNPGGETYSLEARLKLIDIARKYDMLIITDDVYDLLDYTQSLKQLPTILPRLTHLDRATATNEYGNTVSNSTFSKLVAPGLRVGYQESINSKLVYQLCQGGANVSGGSPSQLNAMIVGTLLKDGLIDDVINGFRSVYAKRSKVLKEGIEAHLPKGTTAHGFEGGYFVWVTLPEDYDAKKVVAELKKKNVVLAGGENFEVVGDLRNWGHRSVRLSMSYLTEEQIKEGLELWGATIKECYP
ncbi:CYFA0S01e12398g1_1 [Cyberlindnera fabianii]|uniref:Aromatic-amino-acid aminotransferase 1 n=1 Tax=Cyberlindnera fabianii TaxID=36022 RepID=A0A061AJ15_CYBFA|nr:Aromatic-amino-acid aminotransferase 1 [Cyberlindnera fabianii]CDR37571.1 CYFA0S01e12398g1_1 [Cyberlindnera fabianii]